MISEILVKLRLKSKLKWNQEFQRIVKHFFDFERWTNSTQNVFTFLNVFVVNFPLKISANLSPTRIPLMNFLCFSVSDGVNLYLKSPVWFALPQIKTPETSFLTSSANIAFLKRNNVLMALICEIEFGREFDETFRKQKVVSRYCSAT